MPAGLTNPVRGYAGFYAVKLAGYSLAGWYLSRSYRRPDTGALRVGATRTSSAWPPARCISVCGRRVALSLPDRGAIIFRGIAPNLPPKV